METIIEVDENKENMYEVGKKIIFIAPSQRKIFGVIQGQCAPSNPSRKTVNPKFEIFEDLKSKAKENPVVTKIKKGLASLRVDTPRKEHLWSEDYVSDNHEYLRTAELKYIPKSDFLKHQPHIDEKMRAILIDWLVLASVKYQMQPETLHLAVSYIDRFLCKVVLAKSKFQLLGVTSLMIAAKFEEVLRPRLQEFVKITDGAYDKDMVRKTEEMVLQVLTYDLSVPTSIDFLRIYCYVSDLSSKVKYLAMYICELGILMPSSYLPSCVAASAIALARHTLDTKEQHIWPLKLEMFSGYTMEDLKDCVNMLEMIYKKELQLPEIKKKYASSRYNEVSRILPRPENVFG